MVRILNRARLLSSVNRRLSTVTSGKTLAFWRTSCARCDSVSGLTAGSLSFRRIVTSVPPVKSILNMPWPRMAVAIRPSTIKISEPAMQ